MEDNIRKEIKLRHKYLWEFRRRNKDFQAWLTSLEKEVSGLFNKKFQEKIALKIKKDESTRRYTKRIFGKLFLNKKSESYNFFKTEMRDKWLGILERYIGIRPTYGYPELWDDKPDDEPLIGGSIEPDWRNEIEFTVNLIWPKKIIMKEIERYIDIHREKLLKEEIKIKRHRWNLYDEYLKIWDLRQEGNTFEQIAKILDPSLKDVKLDSELSRSDKRKDNKVKKYMKRLEELLNQGYSDNESTKKANKEFGLAEDEEIQKLRSSIKKVWERYKQVEKLINESY